MTRLEEDKKGQAYADLKVFSSSLCAHKEELGRALRQRDEWKDTWLN